MPNNLSFSKMGLDELIKHEGSVDGLYDDPSHYATFGIGHLVHKAPKTRSVLLAAAKEGGFCADRLKTRFPGKPYAMQYLEREATTSADFERLKAFAKEKALDILAQAKHKIAFKDLAPEQKAAVKVAADAAVAEEVRLLTQTVAGVLAQDVRPFEQKVNEVVTGVALLQDEFDALVLFAYNVGPDAFRRSSLVKRINENKYRTGAAPDRKMAIDTIEQAFLVWNTSAGKVLEGLTRRRKAEADLFLKAARRELAQAPAVPPPAPDTAPRRAAP